MALGSFDAIRDTKRGLGGPDVPTKDLFRLDGRTILITGGAGAMGVTIAGSVLESGGDVILFDLPGRLPQDHSQYLDRRTVTHDTCYKYFQADVTSRDHICELFETHVRQSRFPLRGLVNCAGQSDVGPSIEYSVDKLRRIFDVNVSGNFICCQAAAQEFTRLGVPGSIVIVASMSGYGANKGVNSTAYNSSKSALHQLTRSLAAEWGSSPDHPLIRVNSLSPGYIRTAATAGALEKPGREVQWANDNMLNRLSEIDEFRAPIMFLLSDGSSFMTGSDLRVDGGHCAW